MKIQNTDITVNLHIKNIYIIRFEKLHLYDNLCITQLYFQCRDIGYEIHEEVLKVLHELHTAMKTHHNYQSEFRQAESKLQVDK